MFVNVCAFTARCPLGNCPAPAGRVQSPAARENQPGTQNEHSWPAAPRHSGSDKRPSIKAQRTTSTPQRKHTPCLQVAQRVLRLRIGQAAHKVDVEEVVEGALRAAAARLCGRGDRQAEACGWLNYGRRALGHRASAAAAAPSSRAGVAQQQAASHYAQSHPPDRIRGLARMGRDSILVMSMSRSANTLSALNSMPGPYRGS